MKPWQITIFIFLTITCLGIISFFYPDDGLRLAGHDIRFPSIEKVLADPDEGIPDLPGDSLKTDDRIPAPTPFNRKKRGALSAESADGFVAARDLERS